jgi:hypothetical protein
MLASQIPTKVPLPFANSGTKNTIPSASQIGITAGAASLTDGFPPLTFTPLASGGVPPAGADFNGIFNLITAVQQWQSAGGAFKYDAAFSTTIGGYPAGAILASTSNTTYWLNLADSNTTDPDSGAASNWTPIDAYGIGAVTGLTNANVTLTPAQYGKNILTLAGTLTGNVQIIFPNNQQLTTVANNTTGAFTVTCKTAAGTGGAVVQGYKSSFYGDGTNLVNVLPQGGLLNVQVFAATGTYTPTPGAKNVIVEVQGAGGGGGGAGATAAGQVAIGVGGGAGGYAKSRIVNPGVTAVTVGAGGIGGTIGVAGGPGGTSSFGAFVSASGGFGGNSIAATSAFPTQYTGGISGVGTGGNIANVAAQTGLTALLTNGLGNALSGGGGPSLFGAGGPPVGANANGAAGNTGAGGGGALQYNGAFGALGAVGGAGIIIVWEYV